MFSWLSTPSKSAAPPPQRRSTSLRKPDVSPEEGSLSAFRRDSVEYYKRTESSSAAAAPAAYYHEEEEDDEKVYAYGETEVTHRVEKPSFVTPTKTNHSKAMSPPDSGNSNDDAVAGPTDEQESGDDYEDLDDPVPGTLNKYSLEDEIYLPISTRVFASVCVHPENFCDCIVEIRTEKGKSLLRVVVNDERQINFCKKRHSFVWNEFDSVEQSIHTFEFVFHDQGDESNFKKLLAIKMFESSREERFEDAISKNDQDWVITSFQPDPQEPAADDEDEEMDFLDEPAPRRTSRFSLTPQKSGKAEHNSHLAVAINYNRSYVVRGSQIGVFRHNDDDEMEYVTSIPDVQTSYGQLFSPSKVVLHKGDRRFLMLNPDNTESVLEMDIETQQVVAEYQRGEDVNIRDVSNAHRYAQKTDESIFIGTNNNSVFTIDPRVSGSDKTARVMTYKKNPYLTCAAANGIGGVVVGNRSGELRLFNDVGKRAKTSLPGLGHAIKGIDTTEDGSWLLATSSKYLLVAPTSLPDGRTGFDVSMGKNKPVPFKLQIKPEDIAKYKIRDIDFTTAKFDTGEAITEKWIIASTGPFVITWNFEKIRRYGIVDDYKIKKYAEQVVSDQFRYNMENQVVVTMVDDVILQKRSSRNRAV